MPAPVAEIGDLGPVFLEFPILEWLQKALFTALLGLGSYFLILHPQISLGTNFCPDPEWLQKALFMALLGLGSYFFGFYVLKLV